MGQSITAAFANATTSLGSGFQQPTGLAADAAGDVFVADNSGTQVTKIAAVSGAQTVIANNLKNPTAVTLDAAGDIFISDGGNNRVVMVPAGGGPQVTVGASGLVTPIQTAIDTAGNLYIVDNGNSQIVKISANGAAPSAAASGLSNPQGVAIDSTGTLFVSELGTQDIAVFAPNAKKQTVALSFAPTQVALDGSGNLYIGGVGGVDVLPAGSNTPTNILSGVGFVQGVALDSLGRLYISTGGQTTVSEYNFKYGEFGSLPICALGQASSPGCSSTLTLNFDGPTPSDVEIEGPFTLGATGADFKLAPGTTCGTRTEGVGCQVNVSFVPTLPGLRLGAVKLLDLQGNTLTTANLAGRGQGPLAAFLYSHELQAFVTGLNKPASAVQDGMGNTYIADTFNNRLLKVTPAGTQIEIATGQALLSGLAVDGAGNVYMAQLPASTLAKIDGQNGSASVLGGGLTQPAGIAVNAAGDVFVADSGNNRVVKIPANGSAQVAVGSGLTGPTAVALNGTGHLYIADTGNNRVVDLFNGNQTTIGEGLNQPQGVAVNAAGDVFISDTGNNRVVIVPPDSPQTNLTTAVSSPLAISVSANGLLLIADSGNNRIDSIPFTPPASLPFASTLIGHTSSDSPQSVQLANIGNQPLSLSEIDYPPDFPVDFSANSTADLCIGMEKVPVGEACELAIDFTPLSLVMQPEPLNVFDDSLNNQASTQTIPLKGTALLSQSVVFLLPSSGHFNPAPTDLKIYAAATSGLPVSFKIVSGPAKLSGSVVTLTGAGMVVIQASQSGNASYAAATPVTKSIAVSKAVPTLAWPAPAPITYGTKLGGAQLDATASAAGKLAYSPPAGTVLAAGAQTLKVTFTPTNTSGYASLTATVKIAVNKAPLKVTANNQSMKQGGKVPALTASYAGFVNGDTASKALTGAPAITTTATSASKPGNYPITIRPGTLAAKNYSFTFVNGTLTVSASTVAKGPPGISRPLPPRVPRPAGAPSR